MRSRDEQVELELKVCRVDGATIAVTDGSTERQTHVGKTEVREKWFWLPVSQIEIEDHHTIDEALIGQSATMRLPEWLAQDRGLI